jgi:hypothetical protein
MLVEGRLGDAGHFDDLVDADGGEAATVDQLDRRGDEPLAAGLGRIGEFEQFPDGFGARGVVHGGISLRASAVPV